MRPVIAGEPDFVDAIVERGASIVRHDLTHIGHQPSWIDRKTGVIGGNYLKKTEQPL